MRMTHPTAATATSTAAMKVPSNLAFEFAVFRFVTISFCFYFLSDVVFVVVFIFCSTGTRRKCVACGTWKRAIADGYSTCYCCCSAAIFEIRRAYFSYFAAASSRHIWIVLPLTVFVTKRDHNSNCNNSRKGSRRDEKLMLSCALNISTFSSGFFYPSYSVPRLSPSLLSPSHLSPRSTAFLPRVGHLLFFVCTFSARSSSFFHSFFLPVYFTSMYVRAPSWQLCCDWCKGER